APAADGILENRLFQLSGHGLRASGCARRAQALRERGGVALDIGGCLGLGGADEQRLTELRVMLAEIQPAHDPTRGQTLQHGRHRAVDRYDLLVKDGPTEKASYTRHPGQRIRELPRARM